MGQVKSKDTKPEWFVRRLIWALGFHGYRLHVRKLPGAPDIVFGRMKKTVFVHGCFWHRHQGCAACRLPKTRLDFWKPKLDQNRRRDILNMRRLKRMGWKVLVVWECEIARIRPLTRRLNAFLGRT